MWLSSSELKQMTGVSKRTLQLAWLKKNRIPFTLGHAGHINVLRAYVERAHGMKDIEVEEEYVMPMERRMKETHGTETRQSRGSA
jgi:hypothetical protein